MGIFHGYYSNGYEWDVNGMLMGDALNSHLFQSFTSTWQGLSPIGFSGYPAW